ncbi:hypothetical protein C8R43DRAFT_1174922, partial [Mycena crocata]
MVQQEGVPRGPGLQSMGSFVDVLLGLEATTDTVPPTSAHIPGLISLAMATAIATQSPLNPPFPSTTESASLYILDIARANLPYAEFAVRSACHAAVPDPDTPDEFGTLAAALQFAGCKHILGDGGRR